LERPRATEEFFMTSPVAAPAAPQFGLAGLLVCDGCDAPLQTVVPAGGRRGYRAPCACGPAVIDAAAVERRVRDAVEQHSTAMVGDVPAEALGGVFAALFVAVRVAGDDLSLVWRMY
jgi:hypothetical protein